MRARIVIVFALILSTSAAWAKRIEIPDSASEVSANETPATGKEAASKYFTKSSRKPAASSGGSREHYMALHIGGFVSSDSYMWGKKDHSENDGKLTLGVSYRLGEWINAADFVMRGDFISYGVDEYKPLKLSILFTAIFPDSASQFPLYFGGGIGPGIFFKQARQESPLAVDYQLFGGIRFFDVFDNVGLFAEAGLKNHLHVLSDGQFNGLFFAVGALFTF